MFDWIKSFIQNRVVSLAIGYVVSALTVGGVGAWLQGHGVTIDSAKLQADLFMAYQGLAHLMEAKTAGTRFEWIGKIL